MTKGRQEHFGRPTPMTGEPKPAVYVDFHNADRDGFVRLNTNGTRDDLDRLGIVLEDGLNLVVSDLEITIEGTVCSPGAEGVWRLLVDWEKVFRTHAQRQ